MGTLNGDLVTTYDSSQGIDVNGSGQLVTTTGDGIQHDGGDIATTQKQRTGSYSDSDTSLTTISPLAAPFDSVAPDNAVVMPNDPNGAEYTPYIQSLGANQVDIGYNPAIPSGTEAYYKITLLGDSS